MPGLAPFDPIAALAVLLTYTPPSAPNLLRALAEHADTFAGAQPIGHGGDKIQLADGRIYDCIFNVDGPPGARRWQMLYIDPNDPGGPPDPFALEQGPLAYVDEDLPIIIGGGDSFESIVTGELAALDGADPVLADAGQAIVAFDGADALDGSARALLQPATDAHEQIRAALDDDNPADVIDATNSHGGEIAAGQGDYAEAPVPDQPVPDPGDPPDPGTIDNPPPPAA